MGSERERERERGRQEITAAQGRDRCRVEPRQWSPIRHLYSQLRWRFAHCKFIHNIYYMYLLQSTSLNWWNIVFHFKLLYLLYLNLFTLSIHPEIWRRYWFHIFHTHILDQFIKEQSEYPKGFIKLIENILDLFVLNISDSIFSQHGNKIDLI